MVITIYLAGPLLKMKLILLVLILLVSLFILFWSHFWWYLGLTPRAGQILCPLSLLWPMELIFKLFPSELTIASLIFFCGGRISGAYFLTDKTWAVVWTCKLILQWEDLVTHSVYIFLIDTTRMSWVDAEISKNHSVWQKRERGVWFGNSAVIVNEEEVVLPRHSCVYFCDFKTLIVPLWSTVFFFQLLRLFHSNWQDSRLMSQNAAVVSSETQENGLDSSQEDLLAQNLCLLFVS